MGSGNGLVPSGNKLLPGRMLPCGVNKPQLFNHPGDEINILGLQPMMTYKLDHLEQISVKISM